MLTPRLNDCVACSTIPVLLNDIDCKMTDFAKRQYNNIVFALNNKLSFQPMLDLLHYKRILTNKFCNADYASCYSVSDITSRVKLLIHK